MLPFGISIALARGVESELIAAILAGDVQLYHELVRLYERSVYIVSLSYMRNEKDAEEVTQETFAKAFRDLSDFRGESNFSTWLFGIARNEARSRLQRQETIRHAFPDEPKEQEMPMSPALLRDWQELPSDAVEREEIRRLLQQAVLMLPRTYRQAYLLRNVGKLDVNETAQILGINTAAVKVTLHRGRMMLQRFLALKLKAIHGVSTTMRFQ